MVAFVHGLPSGILRVRALRQRRVAQSLGRPDWLLGQLLTELQSSNHPQWHRVFTETLQRLHLTKPQRQSPHVATADDPWLAEPDHAFGDLEGKLATADVWKILKLSSYGRTMDDQLRLTAAMRLLGWDRKLLRFRNQQVGRGFVRRGDLRTIWVFICPVTGQDSYVGHDPAPSESMLPER